MRGHNFSIHQHGVSLVQFIIALLLIGSSVIGVAAIYVMLDNIQRGSRDHERAVKLAKEIAAPIAEAASVKENFETGLGTTCGSKLSKLDTTINMVACWQNLVEQELTDGAARITLDTSTIPAQYVIVVSWSEPRSGTASYVLRVTPGYSKAAAVMAVPDATRAAG